MTDNNKSFATHFLDDYIGSSAWNRVQSFNAFKMAYDSSTNPDAKRIFIPHMFSQFASSLEDLIAGCIAIKHREAAPGFVYAFITYNSIYKGKPSTTIKQFLKEVRDNKPLPDLLNLPDIAALESKLQSMPGTLDVIIKYHQRNLMRNKKEFSSEGEFVSYLYNDIQGVLVNASDAYFKKDKLLIEAYNKVKHGFTVIGDVSFMGINDTIPAGQGCWIVIPNNEYFNNTSTQSPIKLLKLVESDLDLYENQVRTYSAALISLFTFLRVLLAKKIISAADN